MKIEEMKERLKGLTVQQLYVIGEKAGVHGNTVLALSRGKRKNIFASTKEKLEFYFEQEDTADENI